MGQLSQYIWLLLFIYWNFTIGQTNGEILDVYDQRFVGCFSERRFPASKDWTFIPNLQINISEECVEHCMDEGYALAAISNSSCYCGTIFGSELELQTTKRCFDNNGIRCAGNKAQWCGGTAAALLFWVCNPGFGGANCGVKCDQICDQFVCRNDKLTTCADEVSCCFKDTCYAGQGQIVEAGQTRLPCSKDSCSLLMYGKNCDFTCSASCKSGPLPGDRLCHAITGECLHGCATRTVDTDRPRGPWCLTSCFPGFWGSECEHDCFQCQEHECSSMTGVCVLGCGDKFTGTLCTDCADKTLWGDRCDGVCPATCVDRACASDGKCKDCALGMFGPYCEETCPAHCSGYCDRKGVCFEGCEDGWWGKTCAEKCPPNCLNDVCKEDESCVQCVTGFYGVTCQYPCSQSCVDGCMRMSGHCTVCTAGFFGVNCKSKCPDCKEEGCAFKTGECGECESTRYGKHCEYPCGLRCVDNLCDKDSGECNLGCTEGFIGPMCTESNKTADTPDNKGFLDSQLSKPGTITALSVVGAFLFIGLIVATGFIVNRWRQRMKLAAEEDSDEDIPVQTVKNSKIYSPREIMNLGKVQLDI